MGQMDRLDSFRRNMLQCRKKGVQDSKQKQQRKAQFPLPELTARVNGQS